jgi:hypothetical protein
MSTSQADNDCNLFCGGQAKNLSLRISASSAFLLRLTYV